MQEVISRKKKTLQDWQHIKSSEIWLAYNETKRKARTVVNKIKASKYEKLYSRLDTKEVINKVYKLAKARKKKTRDMTLHIHIYVCVCKRKIKKF